jgi:transposase-like protein
MCTVNCPECGSLEIVKDGFARPWIARKRLKIQKYRCNLCGRSFREKKKNKDTN